MRLNLAISSLYAGLRITRGILKANLAPPGSTLCSNVIGVSRPWRRFHIIWSLEQDQLRSQRAAMTRDARAVN